MVEPRAGASLIQYHNNAIIAHHRIVTTILQGVNQDQWKTVWTHMQRAEGVPVGETDRPRVRDHLMVAGQVLAQHKLEEISGIYPMNKPGHWRMMIVSHILRHITFLDPFGYGFTQEEIRNVSDAYRGYGYSDYLEAMSAD